jgi:F420H(2)-dependent quinone reductase
VTGRWLPKRPTEGRPLITLTLLRRLPLRSLSTRTRTTTRGYRCPPGQEPPPVIIEQLIQCPCPKLLDGAQRAWLSTSDVKDPEHVRSATAGEGQAVSDERERGPRLPPRWFIRLAWSAHRAVHRVTAGRVGLWRPKRDRWGTLRLTTTGRRTGLKRRVIVAYFEDGENLVTLAMNGWADGEPAWWLNLQAHPDATVDLVDGSRAVSARAAEGEERSRLWARWCDMGERVDAYAALRSSETAVVILEPRALTS